MEYQRFISYIYEYQKSGKRENCGFVKAEIRQNAVRLLVHMYLPDKMDEEYTIYGLIRENGRQEGIVLGKGKVRYGNMDVRLQREPDNVTMAQGDAERFAFGRLCGIVIRSSSHCWYGTAWDDEEINISGFRERREQAFDNCKTDGKNENNGDDTEKEELQTQEMRGLPDWDTIERLCPLLPVDGNNSHVRYLRIEPKDLKYLPQHLWHMGRNSFLLHGYYNYRYMILQKEENRFRIGIPGVYSPMEEGVASMFGFGDFVPAQENGRCMGGFGYWFSTFIDG